MSMRAFADHLGVALRTVAKWEQRLDQIEPRPPIQEVLDAALRLASVDSQKRFGENLSNVDDTTSRTNSAWTEFSAIMNGPPERPSVLEGLTPADDGARRPDWAKVEHVRAVTRALALSENVFGGGRLSDVAVAQLRWAAQLLRVPADSGVRLGLAEAVGNLASVVAHSSFDVSDYTSADHFFEFSLWCADESGSWALRANTLSEMARMAAHLGDLDEALELIEFAQVRSDRLTATARAMLTTVRARLLALTGRHAEAQTDVDHADALFADHDPGEDPPWLCYYDAAEHQGSTGKALIPIAQARGGPELATGRLEAAIRLQGASYPRSRAFSRVRLASLMMVTGRPEEAAVIGRKAAAESVALRSKRLTIELRGLAHASTPHGRLEDVAAMRHDIASLAQIATWHY